MDKEYKFFVDKIVKFNTDKHIIALKDLYNRPSLFEILSKQRSETTYSAFLKWLLNIKLDNNEIISPIYLLLNILVKKLSTDNTIVKSEDYNSHLFNLILTGKLKVSYLDIVTEQSVSELAENIIKEKKNRPDISDSDEKSLIKTIEKKDRIDIFISGDIEGYEGKKKLQIIIENKIDSTEGEQQTERYYKGTQRNDCLQFYLFLKPEFSDDDAKNKHYINISYLDILDGIIMPLLASNCISSRDRFFLEDFKNELMFPNLESSNGRSCIAVSEKISEDITKIYHNHKDFLVDLLLVNLHGEDIWKSGEKYHYGKFLEDSKETPEKVKFIDKDSKEYELLNSFRVQNWNFIKAFLNAISTNELDNIQILIEDPSNQRNSNTVFYKGQCLGQDLSNWETVFKVMKEWTKRNEDVLPANNAELLHTLNKLFPRTINPYYRNGKLLQNLFYDYQEDNNYTFDGTSDKWEGKSASFEFPKSGKKENYITLGRNKITLVKMWRKDALKSFVDYIENFNNPPYEGFEDFEIILS